MTISAGASKAYINTGATIPIDDVSGGNAESFTFIMDDNAEGGVVSTGEYHFADSTLLLAGETVNGSITQYTVKDDQTVKIDGREVNSYTAGKRHATANDIPVIPGQGDGTLTVFTPADKGMMTVYFRSTAFLRVWDFNADGSRNGYADSDAGITQYSFSVAPGHSYVMSTTGKTNNMFYAGYKYLVNEKITNPITVTNVDATLSDSLVISAVDADLGGDEIVITTNTESLELMKGHTYKLSTNDGAVKVLCGESEMFTVTGENVVISLYGVADELLTGKITGTDPATVTGLKFTNMMSGVEYTAEISGDSYTCSMKPGEYNTSVETTNGGVTYDRVSVRTGAENVNEVYVEAAGIKAMSAVPFKSEINVPGDYDSLNAASDAILAMEDRPEGEAGRVTINLTDDLFEQVVMAAPYVTLKGNEHSISWYYGVGTNYYSIEPGTGLYSERLARDKYSYAEGDGNLWGGVFIVRGNNFLAEDTTFKNTYNYELTEAEKTDIAGSILSVDRLAEGADVSAYSFKERSNAFYIEADNIECYHCKILSSQDTLGRNGSANNNYHAYFRKCVIGGNVDYICGEFAAVFDECELQWKTYSGDAKNNGKIGYIAAPKTSPYVFRNCTITTDGAEGSDAVSGLYGRTWGANANASFINTETNGYISETGWDQMSAGEFDSAIFNEYNNTSSGEEMYTAGCKNKTEEAVKNYIDTDEINVTETVLGGWIPVHY